MHSLKYRIATLSPAVISAISGDMNMVATEKYISGTSVLGLLAKRFIDQQKLDRRANENDDFYNGFLAGGLKIGNAYIISRDEYGEHAHFPTPLSIEKQKYDTGVYDFLLDAPEQSAQTERVGGFCYLQDDVVYKMAVETGINFHHKRDRTTGVSEKGVIFNYEAIAAGQMFEGEIRGEKDDLMRLLRICRSNWEAFIGRSRNAQYGAVVFTFVDHASEPLQKQIIWPEDEEGNPAKYISMTLLSDLILYNDCGYPTTEVKDLQAVLAKRLGDVTIEKAVARKNEIENFISVWRLKKPSETCFVAGSAFLLKVTPEKREALAAIQELGLGERTQEGFGRCAFGLQTHAQLQLQDEAAKEAEQEAPKPEGAIPEKVKAIVKEIVQDIIRESMKLKAIEEQRKFARLPSNALIARLHAMVKSADRRNDFVAKLNRFRKIAADQLRRCVSRESNLLEYLAAFQLNENAIKGLQESGFDQQMLAALQEMNRRREYTLVQDLQDALRKKPDDPEKFQLRILAHAEFCHDPVDWQHFFKQPQNVAIKSLCEEIEYAPETDDEFTRDLTSTFFTTFFAEMRKRKIAKEEGRDVE